MTTFIGIVVFILSLICWLGQSLSFVAPKLALKLGVMDPKESMDETLHIIDSKVLGLNDMLLTWTLPLSAALMIFNISLWPFLGLIGGGIYSYFVAKKTGYP